MDLSGWFDGWERMNPDKVAVHFEGQDISFASMAGRIRRLAAMLESEYGIGRGDRVAHVGYNSPELFDLFFACARLGAICVTLNWRLTPVELAWIIGNCTPKLLLAEPDFTGPMLGVKDQLGTTRLCAYGPPAAGWDSYDAVLARAPADCSTRGGDLSLPVTLVYTSGTTGKPKGAVLTQNNVFFNAINSAHVHNFSSEDHTLICIPMFHVGGMHIQATPVLHAGGTITLHRKFDPNAMLRDLEERKPTHTLSVPAVLQAVMSLPRWKDADLSSLKLLMTGSSTVPLPIIEAIQSRGIPVGQVYGSTETCGPAICLRAEDAFAHPGSCGRPLVYAEIRIVDDQGREVPVGVSGEITVRGPNVQPGYWNNPQATADSLKDGWYYTGDIGYRDADGFYFINDRKKDMVISGGENVYPAELENVLLACPAIAEAAVVGRPHPRWVEEVVACVVRKPGASLTAEDVVKLFDGKLARYKHPRAVLFMEALPRNAMGKVLKYELRKTAAATA